MAANQYLRLRRSFSVGPVNNNKPLLQLKRKSTYAGDFTPVLVRKIEIILATAVATKLALTYNSAPGTVSSANPLICTGPVDPTPEAAHASLGLADGSLSLIGGTYNVDYLDVESAWTVDPTIGTYVFRLDAAPATISTRLLWDFGDAPLILGTPTTPTFYGPAISGTGSDGKDCPNLLGIWNISGAACAGLYVNIDVDYPMRPLNSSQPAGSWSSYP